MIELKELSATAPPGCVIGILADSAASIAADNILRAGPGDKFPVDEPALILDHTYSRAGSIEKAKAVAMLRRRSAAGLSTILISQDELFLERASDEIWVVREWRVIDRGDPAEVLQRYRVLVARELRDFGDGQVAPVSPTMRKGDGRAEIRGIHLLGEAGTPSIVWRSGEQVAVEIQVGYLDEVADPVVGIMIRTRIGLNVYGTNTELEERAIGPVRAGDERTVTYRFRCDLCPGDYTLTAASHDPDGTWHEWLEDAVAFTVSDTRFTAGVANLRATVEVS